MAALGVAPPDMEPRATAHIPHIIAMIERLIASGHAYAAQGHVLFAVASYPQYGALSRRSSDDMLAGARVEVRSEDHTSELQSLMRISYAVFCLKKKNQNYNTSSKTTHTIA